MTSLAITNFGVPSIAGWLKRIRNKMKRNAEIRATIKQLSALSDRELNDMGLSRGDIYSVAHSTTDIRRSLV